MTPTKVRETFNSEKAANYSEFTRETVKVGEALEALGYELESEVYSQGTQTLLYKRGAKRAFTISLSLEQDD